MPTRIALLLGHFTYEYSGFSLSQCSEKHKAPDRKTQWKRGIETCENLLVLRSVQFENTLIFLFQSS